MCSSSGFQGALSENVNTMLNNFKLTNAFGMMAGMTVLFLVLLWYLDNVFPSEYGVPKHPLFFLTPST